MAAPLAVSLLACGQASRQAVDPGITREVDILVARSTPEGTITSNFTPPVRDRSGVHSSWEIETDSGWPLYCTWLTSRMPPDYKASGSCETQLTFRKQTPGDVYALQAAKVTTRPRLHVRVTFDGYPY